MTIINNSYRFVFVHVPKAAGTSVTAALGVLTNYCDQEIGGTVFGEEIQGAYLKRFGLAKHSTAAEIRSLIGAVTWNRYFTFSFVRNPFTRAASTYNFLRKWPGPTNSFIERMRAFQSFDDYVLSDIWDEGHGPDQIFRPQAYWLREAFNSKLLPSFVGKLETLGEDLRHILDVIDAPTHIKERIQIPHANQSGGDGSAQGISERPKVLNRILEKYSIDFDQFDYPRAPPTVFGPSG